MLRFTLTILTILSLSSNCFASSEASEWFRALGFVYLSHEAGHSLRAGGGELATWKSEGGLLPDYRIAYRPVSTVDPKLVQSVSYGESINSTDKLSVNYLSSLKAKLAQEKAKQDVPLDYNLRLEASIAGGGYVSQQNSVNALAEGDFKRKVTVLSGLLNAVYVPWSLWGTPAGYTGDIKRIEQSVPLDLIVTSLLVSATTDFWRAAQPTMPTWHVDVVSDPKSGAFGLAYAGVF